jgi:broad specificity phosphatase PhoE
MAKLYLVRHGKATAGWGMEKDPGLDDLGHAQAKATALTLAPLGPLPIITSPLTRTRETSKPLAEIWDIEPQVEKRVGEIRFPSGYQSSRVQWLQSIMGEKWPNLDPDLKVWRREVIKALSSCQADCVVFTHFIAINTAVGHATGDDRVVSFRPDNCSITIMETNGNSINLVKRGNEADTRVN